MFSEYQVSCTIGIGLKIRSWWHRECTEVQGIALCRPGSAQNWSRQFPVPSGATSKCPGRYAAGNRKLPGSNQSWYWPMSYHSMHHPTLSISPGPDFQSNSNGTTHMIFRKHLGKIFVYSCLSPAIKVGISDQLSLYYTQSLPHSTLTILLGPVFWARSDGALYCAIKVLRGNVYWHLAVAVQSMCTIFWSYTCIFKEGYATRARLIRPSQK